MSVRIALAALALLGLAAPAAPQVVAALPKGAPIARLQQACKPDLDASDSRNWAIPAPPIKVFGNVYLVGTCAISVVLIVSPQGHVLIDAGPPAAAPLVIANIRELGLRPEDVKWMVTSHEHYDHVGALAEIKRLTGAQLAASTLAQPALEGGKSTWRDPLVGGTQPFVGAKVDRVMHSGEHLVLGPLDLTLHSTPGHAPGSTSWTWQSCEGATCRQIAYIDSLTTVSNETYKFSQNRVYTDAFARSLGTVASLPCDILITPHPGASKLHERLAGRGALVDPQACLTLATGAQAALEARIKQETGGR